MHHTVGIIVFLIGYYQENGVAYNPWQSKIKEKWHLQMNLH